MLHIFQIIYLSIIGLAFIVRPAHAYIDPGTGSYLFQILVGLLAGLVALGAKPFPKLFFWRRKGKPTPDSSKDPQDKI